MNFILKNIISNCVHLTFDIIEHQIVHLQKQNKIDILIDHKPYIRLLYLQQNFGPKVPDRMYPYSNSIQVFHTDLTNIVLLPNTIKDLYLIDDKPVQIRVLSL